jgi:coenzyme F420-reducing hydrogenase beta subunit
VTRVEFVDGELVVYLEDGRSVHVPLEWFAKPRDASR